MTKAHCQQYHGIESRSGYFWRHLECPWFAIPNCHYHLKQKEHLHRSGKLAPAYVRYPCENFVRERFSLTDHSLSFNEPRISPLRTIASSINISTSSDSASLDSENLRLISAFKFGNEFGPYISLVSGTKRDMPWRYIFN